MISLVVEQLIKIMQNLKPNILLISRYLSDNYLDIFQSKFNCTIFEDIKNLDNFFSNSGTSITGVATFSGIDKELISKLTNLKIISCFGVGYDSIDVNAALERNIIVTHTPNVLNEEVASTTLLLLLAAKRQLISNYNWIIDGNWEKKGNAPLTNTIEKLHVGLLGYGRIGQAIARKLLAFNCDISYHARNKVENSSYKYYKNLLEMARNVECLIVITPGGPDTEKIVDKSIIEALGPKGTLINIARGSVVDEKALVECVINKKIGSVALDVFENEPKVPRELFNLDNVILAPHIGSSTHETRKAMLDLVIENLELYFNNKKVRTPVPECNKLMNLMYK